MAPSWPVATFFAKTPQSQYHFTAELSGNAALRSTYFSMHTKTPLFCQLSLIWFPTLRLKGYQADSADNSHGSPTRRSSHRGPSDCDVWVHFPPWIHQGGYEVAVSWGKDQGLYFNPNWRRIKLYTEDLSLLNRVLVLLQSCCDICSSCQLAPVRYTVLLMRSTMCKLVLGRNNSEFVQDWMEYCKPSWCTVRCMNGMMLRSFGFGCNCQRRKAGTVGSFTPFYNTC